MIDQKIRFYLNRLRALQPVEISHRFKELRFNKMFNAHKNARFLNSEISNFSLPSVLFDQVESVMPCDNDIEMPEKLTFEKNNRVKWTSVKRMDEQLDIRTVWDTGRLQKNFSLMMKSNGLDGEQDQAVTDKITDWITANPLGIGPHYMSAMECGLRIPVFTFALFKPKNLTETQRNTLIKAIYEHAWFVSHRLSLYSSLGNHTVSECVGLAFAGALFRDDRRGQKWLSTSIRLLEQELIHQILDDGGPAEQSLNYHRFVLDLYWLAVDLLEKNELHDCSTWKPRLEHGEHFLRCFENSHDDIPSIGDSDDGYALGPGLCPQRGSGQRQPKEPCHVFKDSGYTILNGLVESKLIFDHGPLGMAPLYNHGHADALSVLISVHGLPFLIDPGTYRYNGVPEWRRYFKSTRAHNTVTVDDKDQAVYETGFIWSKPWHISEYSLAEDQEGLTVMATHDGYCRLSEPVKHHRTVRQDGSGYQITDTFSGKGWHDFELNYHLHPEVELMEQDGTWLLNRNGVGCRLWLETGAFTLSQGLENPIKGWFSPGYNLKTPCPVLTCRVRGRADQVSFVTRFDLYE